MTVKRIVANIAADDLGRAKKFYAGILGLEVAMDLGWIVTFAAERAAAPQISIAKEGGSGTPVPDISIWLITSRKFISEFSPQDFRSNMARALSLGG